MRNQSYVLCCKIAEKYPRDSFRKVGSHIIFTPKEEKAEELTVGGQNDAGEESHFGVVETQHGEA